jgi:gas vesicle protein
MMEGNMANPQGPSNQETRAGADTPDDAREVGRQAREAAEEVKQEARAAADQAKEQARSAATRQKDAAAQQIGGWAQALRTASDDLHSRGQDAAAAYVRQAADGLERASGTVHARDVDELIGSVEDFARRQPVAFLGGAVAAGFGLARFMRSSADRRRSAAASARSGQGEGP